MRNKIAWICIWILEKVWKLDLERFNYDIYVRKSWYKKGFWRA